MRFHANLRDQPSRASLKGGPRFLQTHNSRNTRSPGPSFPTSLLSSTTRPNFTISLPTPNRLQISHSRLHCLAVLQPKNARFLSSPRSLRSPPFSLTKSTAKNYGPGAAISNVSFLMQHSGALADPATWCQPELELLLIILGTRELTAVTLRYTRWTAGATKKTSHSPEVIHSHQTYSAPLLPILPNLLRVAMNEYTSSYFLNDDPGCQV